MDSKKKLIKKNVTSRIFFRTYLVIERLRKNIKCQITINQQKNVPQTNSFEKKKNILKPLSKCIKINFRYIFSDFYKALLSLGL